MRAKKHDLGVCPCARCTASLIALKIVLQRIVDHYDMRTDLYTSDADLAAGMAAIARKALLG